MIYPSYAELWRPELRKSALAYDIVLVLGGSLAVALSAQLSIRIGPVPITAQSMAVVLVGFLLGSRRGALCIAAYLAEGAAGLPVFAGGHGGLAYLLGPTGGYLAGFLVAAWLCGRLAEHGWDRRRTSTLAAMMLAHLAIYLPGLSYMSALFGLEKALQLGLYPFIPGDMLKILLATALLPAGWKLLHIDHKH